MKALTEYDDYKAYVHARIENLPKKGRGEYRRIATHLKVHTTLVSQVFNGTRELTLEQATELAEFFLLTERETRYFLLMVEYGRAGSAKLRAHFKRELNRLRAESEDLQKRLKQDRTLSPEEQAQFYSRWSYSGVRLFASVLDAKQARDPVRAIAEGLNLDPVHVLQVMEFLKDRGLLRETITKGRAKLELGAQRIHVANHSPWVVQHHRNWRALALSRAERVSVTSSEDLMFTAPLTIANSDRPRVRKLMLALIDEVSAIVTKSEADSLCVFNLDWLKV